MVNAIIIDIRGPLYKSFTNFIKESPDFHEIDLYDLINCPVKVLASHKCVVITDCDATFDYLIHNGYYLPTIGIRNPEFPKESLFKASCLLEDYLSIDLDYIDYVFRRFYKLSITIGTTQRTSIKEISLSDLPALYDLYKLIPPDPCVHPLTANMKEESEKLKAYIQHCYGFYGYGLWGIFSKESNCLIGHCGIQPKTINGCGINELSYLIHPEYQKKGYGFEVCKTILSLAKNQFEIETLYLFTTKDNTASMALARKLNFHLLEEKSLITMTPCQTLICKL